VPVWEAEVPVQAAEVPVQAAEVPVQEAEVPVQEAVMGLALVLRSGISVAVPPVWHVAAVAWVIWDPRGSGSREEADWVEVGGWKKMPDSGLGRRSVGLVWFGWVWFGLVWFGFGWFGLVSAGLVWFRLVWFGFGWSLGFRPGNFSEDNRSGCLSYSSLS